MARARTAGTLSGLRAQEADKCESIFRSIMRSHNLLHRIGSDIAGEFDLHITELNVIDRLGKHGPLSMGELAAAAFFAPSSTTRTVKQLEARGLVQRQRSRHSERVVTVSLTPAGQRLFRKSYPKIVQAVQEKLEERLDSTERRTLSRLLEKLVS